MAFSLIQQILVQNFEPIYLANFMVVLLYGFRIPPLYLMILIFNLVTLLRHKRSPIDQNYLLFFFMCWSPILFVA